MQIAKAKDTKSGNPERAAAVRCGTFGEFYSSKLSGTKSGASGSMPLAMYFARMALYD